MHSFPFFRVTRDGFVRVCNGSTWADYSSVEDFQKDEPEFELPEGVAAISYELREAPIAVCHKINGGTEPIVVPDPWYDGYIAKAETYAATQAIRAAPFYQVEDLAEAQAIAEGLMVTALEGAFEKAAPTKGYMHFERDTFERQLAEAQAFTADPNTETPWLSAILKEGESVADLAGKVLASHAELRQGVVALMAAKRLGVQQMEALGTVEEIKEFAARFVAAAKEGSL